MFSRRSYAVASAILVMVVWGSTYVVTKAAVDEIPALTLGFLRFLIASAVLVPTAAARGGLKRLTPPGALAPLALMALTGVAGFTAAFNYALIFGSASQGALTYALVPAAVALAAVVWLKEAPSKRRMAGIALSIGGVGLVVATSQPDAAAPDPLFGALCMLAAVAAWAVYTVIAKTLAAADQIAVTAWLSVVGAGLLLPLAVVELMIVPWPSPSLRAWLGTLYLGVIASGLSYVLYNLALRELDASLVGALVNLDPIVGVLTAVLFLGEVLRPWQIVGGLGALAGMWLASSGASIRPGRSETTG